MKTFKYPCLHMVQRPGTPAPAFCLFTAKVGEIHEWASIERLADKGGAAQRGINKAKVAAINRFFELDARNSVPTAVVVNLKVPDGALAAVQVQGFPDGTFRALTI